MSKLEEALEKANRLRESTGYNNSKKLNVFKKVKPIKVSNHNLITINEPDSPVSEEYRRLKSILIRDTKANFLNTIMITSSIDGEGKTLTAINLAVTLAQEIDRSILLVDSDLRKPTVHEYIGIKYKYGLSDYLTKDIDISEILVRTDIGNLVFIPAGPVIKNPVELLSSRKMEDLIKELKQRYMDRFVIIDTPPILSFAEGIAIGSYADGVVYVVKEGHAQKKTIEHSLNMIKDLNILGVVFNNVSSMNLDENYSYYYRYKKREKK